MASGTKNNHDEATADLACTRCRERKIRCGRERPECGNCERDNNATCIYRQPAKRVNHLKLLCKSVDRLHDRLDVMQSRLAQGGKGAAIHHNGVPDAASVLGGWEGNDVNMRSDDEEEDEEDDDDDDDDEDERGNHCILADHPAGGDTFRDPINNAARWHGPAALYSLCTRLCRRLASSDELSLENRLLVDMLKPICESAGKRDSLPSFNERSTPQTFPEDQVTAAAAMFLHHVDYSTDIFVPGLLYANVKHIYSQPEVERDETWLICLKTVVLIALGLQIPPQSGRRDGALFSNLARSMLPSRAEMLNSRLLTTPRLINVQTLILLSTTMQRLDCLGWAELIFSHACMLARMMNLRHSPPNLLRDDVPPEVVENDKVVRALYCKDKSFYVNYGLVPWLSGGVSGLAHGMIDTANQPGLYAGRVALALLQDDIYCLAYTSSSASVERWKKASSLSHRIERRLGRFAPHLDLVTAQMPGDPEQATLHLEFLGTRILALQAAAEPRHAGQVLSDARASCDVFLATLNNRDSDPSHYSSPHGDMTVMQLADLLDAFSLPAFFVLLDALLDRVSSSDPSDRDADHERLRNVTDSYRHCADQLQINNYHFKVACILGQLASVVDIGKESRRDRPDMAPPTGPSVNAPPIRSASASSGTIAVHNHAVGLPPDSTSVSQTDVSMFPFAPISPTGTSALMGNLICGPDSPNQFPTYPNPSDMDCLGFTFPDPFESVVGRPPGPMQDTNMMLHTPLSGIDTHVAPNLPPTLDGQGRHEYPATTTITKGPEASRNSGPRKKTNSSTVRKRRRNAE